MQAYHDNLESSQLVRVQYYDTNKGNICLQAVSGRNLGHIKKIPHVFISIAEYNDRETDWNNDQIEFFWAIKKLGFSAGDCATNCYEE